MHHKEISNNPEKINSGLLLFAERYQCKRIKFPSGQKYWEKSKHENENIRRILK